MYFTQGAFESWRSKKDQAMVWVYPGLGIIKRQ